MDPLNLSGRRKPLTEGEALARQVEQTIELPLKFECRDTKQQEELYQYLDKHHYPVKTFTYGNEHDLFIWR